MNQEHETMQNMEENDTQEASSAHENANPFEEESRKAREATQKLKKKILIVAACMVVFAIAATLLMPVLDRALSGEGKEEETTRRPNTVIYYDPDYDYDIMKDEEYLGLDRYIYYMDARTNETIIILDHEINGYGPAMVTLKAMLDAIIAGDHEAYNALFSANYYATNEDRQPEPPFTMQQVYDILITRVNVTDVVDEKLGKYTQYEYTVEYKIHKNNGTFRTDLGHDDSRKQYFILSDSTGPDVLIDQILGYQYKN